MEHRISYRVYYEDTDCLGMVYHANYLRYCERGRTEMIGAMGKEIADWNREGYFFVVYNMNIKFRRTGRLNDIVEVVTRFKLTTPYRALFQQRVERNGEALIEADVEVVCLDNQQRLCEFPEAFSTL